MMTATLEWLNSALAEISHILWSDIAAGWVSGIGSLFAIVATIVLATRDSRRRAREHAAAWERARLALDAAHDAMRALVEAGEQHRKEYFGSDRAEPFSELLADVNAAIPPNPFAARLHIAARVALRRARALIPEVQRDVLRDIGPTRDQFSHMRELTTLFARYRDFWNRKTAPRAR
jgi:hypothetical protein